MENNLLMKKCSVKLVIHPKGTTVSLGAENLLQNAEKKVIYVKKTTSFFYHYDTLGFFVY